MHLESEVKKYLLSTAFYGYFISSWLSKFPREQDLFLDYEEFKRSPQLTVGKIAKFLGLKDSQVSNLFGSTIRQIRETVEQKFCVKEYNSRTPCKDLSKTL